MALPVAHIPTTQAEGYGLFPPRSMQDVRQALGISQERLARVLDVSTRSIQRWEAANELPTNRWVRSAYLKLGEITSLAEENFTRDGVRKIMVSGAPGYLDAPGLEMVEQGRADDVFGTLATTADGAIGT